MTGSRRAWVTAAAVALCAVTAFAQLSTSDRAAVEAYRSAIASAESRRGPRAVESAFAAMGPMRQALLQARNGKSVLESLTADAFDRLARFVPGAIIGRDEILIVLPDVDYFVKLAASRGDAGDRAFFATLKATYTNPVWSVYIEQQTDYSGSGR